MGLVDLLLPPACAGCGRFGHLVCDACLAGFRAASAPDDRFVASDPGTIVGEALELAIAAFAHDGDIPSVYGLNSGSANIADRSEVTNGKYCRVTFLYL